MNTTRNERLGRLRDRRRVAALVVGGGINGISTYRELALQGVDVLLVERGDFMSGASSAPSRMIHGGLRYMENGEFGLVRESLRERNRLLQNAPHYVSPLPTLIPMSGHLSGIGAAISRFFGGTPKPGARGSLIVKLGLTLYDFYSGRGNPLPRNSFYGRTETRKRWPALSPEITCAALYHDARISYAERLGIEMILDVERDAPQALALNHVEMAGLDGAVATLKDTLTGETFCVQPDVIVNATGAWIDLTNALLAAEAPKFIGGTKGSHLVLRSPALVEALGDKMVYFANRDGRVCILFVHFGNVLAGSTDISVDTPEGVRCEDDETSYILQSVREVFPAVAITEEDILFRFSGVRPLPRGETGVNAAISRDHSCEWLDRAGVPALNLIGGKWTTFRAFGAEAADMVLGKIGMARGVGTDSLAIGGGADYPASNQARAQWLKGEAQFGGICEGRATELLQRYGTRARQFVPPAEDGPVASLPSYSRAEIEWIVENEHVATLGDLILRRTAIAFSGELSLAALEELSAIAAGVLFWSADERRRQVEDLVSQLATNHGLDADALAARNLPRKEADVPVPESPHEPPLRKRQMS
ncbi:glycerol-3-phosphate dehydrogenase [Mesorhizobium albiziae]|uniref:Glycerol-3-phosphate dehydrogenase n=1 Tax=Neomesorhizobium albiziae TaxID=335020 RepID=A0A1I4AI49_9HYPH|nr:glycerol-3-phosphate dehydrogenase/oxidase [Mesorhizobium albiziae]GLS32888.1 glycerol-3-phosphate dehydrogenase [Mesorhizobium albiziae]SFK56098.1 glycerol-3-phosphate dehydrogenase [Mesorhizobium albiziae]